MSSNKNEENWRLISLKIPSSMLEEWDEYIVSKGMKRSEFIRWCVNNEIHSNDKKDESLINLIDKVIKLYISGLERRLMLKFQRMEAMIQANFDEKKDN